MWQEHELKQLYAAIFRRKSVRNYVPEPLPQQTLDEMREKISGLTAALPGAPVAFRLLDHTQVKGSAPKTARHFLALYAGPDDADIINAAFMMQQMDLWLSSRGLGSCWMGMPRPLEEARSAEGLKYVIMMPFGTPAEPAQRESIAEFSRKPLSEITAIRDMDDLLLPLRLTPSAINRQGWYVTGGAEALRLHMKQDNLLLKAALGKMTLVDMGIGLCHLWLAAVEQGRLGSLERETAPPPAPGGYRYAWTLRLKY